MNELISRRMAQSAMFHNAARCLPVMHRAVSITGEKYNGTLLEEEFMRINGQQAMPLLLGPVAAQKLPYAHWNSLNDACAWASSARAFNVRYQSVMTQHAAAVGRLEESIPKMRQTATMQIMTLEHVARVDGISVKGDDK